MENQYKESSALKQWAEDDRPREKLLLKGIQALSNAELLAILIASGTREANAVYLGKRVLALSHNNLNQLGKLSVKELQKIKGIGKVKALIISTALELGRRRKLEAAREDVFIKSSRQAYKYFEPRLSDLKHEEFWVAYLSRNHKIIDVIRISEGGVAGTVADPKKIFKHAIDLLASSIILSHNHPSGNLNPSESDTELTERLCEAGKLLDIKVMDHIIVSDKGYYSFADKEQTIVNREG